MSNQRRFEVAITILSIRYVLQSYTISFDFINFQSIQAIYLHTYLSGLLPGTSGPHFTNMEHFRQRVTSNCTAEVLQRTSTFIPHFIMYVITYQCWN